MRWGGIKMFDKDKCNVCGDCLTNCAYVDYTKEQAVAEMEALISGKPASILSSCITCMACHEYCEKGAQPFDLISAMQEKTQALKVPAEIHAFFDQIEKTPSQVSWGTHRKTIVSLCTLEPFMSPAYAAHPMFDGLTVVKGGEYFCHLAKLHLARPGAMETSGRQFMAALHALEADEIIFFHDECYAMVHKMATNYAEEVSFKATHLLEHITTYLRRHPAAATRQGLKAAYQRPCSSRLVPHAEKMLDDFLAVSGVTRVARRYDRKHALCCGSALKGLGRPEAFQKYQALNLMDAKENGAEAMVYLCPLCGVSLSDACREHGLECLSVMDLVPVDSGNRDR